MTTKALRTTMPFVSTKPTLREAAQVLGAKGGSAKSPRKAAAVRENGKKGGWHTHVTRRPVGANKP